MNEEAQRAVHEALDQFLPIDELVVSWVVVMEVAGTDGRRYLAHRAGGGDAGLDRPMAWTALGMTEAASRVAADQVASNTEHNDKRGE